MTTIVGFGSLAFTDYGAMSSIGWATNLGVGFTTLFALITLPAVMALYAFTQRYRGGSLVMAGTLSWLGSGLAKTKCIGKKKL